MFLIVDQNGIVVAGHSHKKDADIMAEDYRAIYAAEVCVMSEDDYAKMYENLSDGEDDE